MIFILLVSLHKVLPQILELDLEYEKTLERIIILVLFSVLLINHIIKTFDLDKPGNTGVPRRWPVSQHYFWVALLPAVRVGWQPWSDDAS